MAKAKRKTLPKDFDALLKAGDIAVLKAVFDVCELDARGGYSKQTALAYLDCPDELARWLIAQGANLQARDTYQRTPLHNRAASRYRGVDSLLEFGADIHATDTYGDTPLHKALGFANLEAARALLGRGARLDALNDMKLTPLEVGLAQCDNSKIEPMADIAALILAAPANPPKEGLGSWLKRRLLGSATKPALITPRMRDAVKRIGENFEFHRAGFNRDYVESASAALDRLYVLFDVPPVPRRIMHDGRAPIVPRSRTWQAQHQELWELLVPSSGAAATVQGEVIRISGKVGDEIDRNGGVNWDADYKAMTRDFLAHIASGAPLPPADRDRAAKAVAEVRNRDRATADLCELAVQWVKRNPTPIPLSPPAYRR